MSLYKQSIVILPLQVNHKSVKNHVLGVCALKESIHDILFCIDDVYIYIKPTNGTKPPFFDIFKPSLTYKKY